MSDILIADDSKAVRLQVSRLVLDLLPGANIIHAANGTEVLKIWRSASLPALTVLDIHMPGLDGLELLRLMVADGKKPPPVIIYTASRDEIVRAGCLQAGALAVVTKSQGNIEIAIQQAMLRFDLGRPTTAQPPPRGF